MAVSNEITKMDSKLFVEKLKRAATDYKTLYVTGCFGWPLNDKNKQRIIKEYPAKNGTGARYRNIMAATPDTFGFDCVNLIKAILWGWNGDVNAEYGGCKYQSNGVPDETVEEMFGKCTNVSSSFDGELTPGEALWMTGHIGVYIGDGLCVECTPKWANDVQITACNKPKSGYNTRYWSKHGFLPYVNYGDQPEETMIYNIQLTKDVERGDSGDAVVALQQRVCQFSPELEAEVKGHSFTKEGKPDGKFGSGMERTMKKIQEAAGLEANGKCDANFRAFANESPVVNERKIHDIAKIICE